MRRAIYPGTFDPPHRGHLDLIRRGRLLVDELIVAVAVNRAKDAVFPQAERVELLKNATDKLAGVRIVSFSGLVVSLARSEGVELLLRGIRTFSDFESEVTMALTNRQLAEGSNVETIFVLPSLETSHFSSRLVKEIASFDGDIRSFLPASIAEQVARRLSAWREGRAASE